MGPSEAGSILVNNTTVVDGNGMSADRIGIQDAFADVFWSSQRSHLAA